MHKTTHQKMCEDSRRLSLESERKKLQKIIRENNNALSIKEKLRKGVKKKARHEHIALHKDKACNYSHFVSRTNQGWTMEQAIATPKLSRGGDRAKSMRVLSKGCDANTSKILSQDKIRKMIKNSS